jgi:hypothetical protein
MSTAGVHPSAAAAALSLLLDAYGRAAARSPTSTGAYRIAGRVIRVHGVGAGFAPLTASWAHLSIGLPSEHRPDLDLFVWDRASTGVPLPTLTDPLSAPDEVVNASDASFLAMRETEAGTFSAYDAASGVAVLFADDWRVFESILAYRLVLHWWLRGCGLSLMHAGAVGRGGRGVLITGRGGLGKSTTCVTALAAGWQFVGDDFVAVGRPAGSGPLVAHSVACSARLAADAIARLSLTDADRPHTYSSDAKALVPLKPRFASGIVDSLEIGAMIVPAIVARPDSRLQPIAPAEAFRAVMSTLTIVVGARLELFADLATLVRQVPCFLLEAGSDPRRLVHTLRGVPCLPVE